LANKAEIKQIEISQIVFHSLPSITAFLRTTVLPSSKATVGTVKIDPVAPVSTNPEMQLTMQNTTKID
jgi:hypothetical protein